MALQKADHIESDATWGLEERINSGAGLVFALILAVCACLQVIGVDFPPAGNSGSEISAYFAKNQTRFSVFVWLSLASTPFQLWFFSTLSVHFRRRRPRSLYPYIGLAAAVLAGAASFFTTITWGVLTLQAGGIEDSALLRVLWSFYHPGGDTLVLISAMIMLAFGLEMLFSGRRWRRLGIYGMAAAAYCAVVWTVLCFSWGKPAPINGVSYILFLVWVPVTAVKLTFGKSA